MGLETNRLGLTWIWSEIGQKMGVTIVAPDLCCCFFFLREKKKDQAIRAMEQPYLWYFNHATVPLARDATIPVSGRNQL